jgi:hypothetical protein
MNVQRWIAFGLVALSVACIASSDLWIGRFMDDDPTPTPTATEAALSEIDDAELQLTGTVTPTLNPIIEEMLAQSGEVAISDQPFIVYSGDFAAVDSMHQAAGTVAIWQIGDGKYVLRLDPFNVTSGPDLHVLLAKPENPRTSTDAVMNSIDLGTLASPTATQNFEVPAGIRLQDYKSVVIYSRSLNLIYSTAKLIASVEH